jgi:hypothetical protein
MLSKGGNMILSLGVKYDLAKFAYIINGLIGILGIYYAWMGISLYLFPILGYVLLAFYRLEMKATNRFSVLIWTASFAYNVTLSVFYAPKSQDSIWMICLVWTLAMSLVSGLALVSLGGKK